MLTGLDEVSECVQRMLEQNEMFALTQSEDFEEDRYGTILTQIRRIHR